MSNQNYELNDAQLRGLDRALRNSLKTDDYDRIKDIEGALISSYSINDELYDRHRRTLNFIRRLLTHPTYKALREKGYGADIDDLVINESFNLADLRDRLEGSEEVEHGVVVDDHFQKVRKEAA